MLDEQAAQVEGDDELPERRDIDPRDGERGTSRRGPGQRRAGSRRRPRPSTDESPPTQLRPAAPIDAEDWSDAIWREVDEVTTIPPRSRRTSGASVAAETNAESRDADEPAIGRSPVPIPEQRADPWAAHDWLDQDAGPVVRPYTVTGGRARPVTGSLDLLTYVEALYAPEADLVHLQPEHRSILDLTRTALSVAEIAAHLDLPVGVVRVLISDLVQANLVSTFSSGAAIHPPDESILQAVIDGLRAL
jgi:hypothetical protein